MKCIEDMGGQILFECPGCKCLHSVHYKNPNHLGARWTWNDDTEKPTFRPSVVVKVVFKSNKQPRICHSFVTDGKIQFLSDCTHSLVGQTVDLPEIDF